jgi:acyl transferase domain-containing protein
MFRCCGWWDQFSSHSVRTYHPTLAFHLAHASILTFDFSDQHMNTAKLGVLSPTSECHTFDSSADGYGRADAVGAVYLKRLSDAVRDGDPIRGVIRSSAVNSNGKVPNLGITHPNRQGQADVIRHAYERGGDLDPRLTAYFECKCFPNNRRNGASLAVSSPSSFLLKDTPEYLLIRRIGHGTGTAVGDPLEVHAVSQAMNTERVAGDEPLWIGAVKTNIGHSEAASGLSAIIKAVLSVEKGIIAPTRGVVNPNPAIKWDDWKVRVATEPVPFPAHLPVKRISVNSFGYGGTNAHVIVESADSFVVGRRNYTSSLTKATPPRDFFRKQRPFLLPFSAHDKTTLKRNIIAHGEVANKHSLLDLSYTLANRRSRFPSRGFVVTSNAKLDSAFANGLEAFAFADKKKTPLIGFAFTGQGAQWAK